MLNNKLFSEPSKNLPSKVTISEDTGIVPLFVADPENISLHTYHSGPLDTAMEKGTHFEINVLSSDDGIKRLIRDFLSEENPLHTLGRNTGIHRKNNLPGFTLKLILDKNQTWYRPLPEKLPAYLELELR